MLIIGSIKTTLLKIFVPSSLVLFTALMSHDAIARIHFHVEPNQTWTAPTSIEQLAIGERLTIINANTNVSHFDDTQGNIHHLLRCNPEGLTFTNGRINIGSTDYAIELYLDGQRKFHCNIGNRHPNYFGPFYDRNTTKNTNVRLDLVRLTANANETSITLPDYLAFCTSNEEDGVNGTDCRQFITDNDYRYHFRTPSGSRTITVNTEKDYGDAGGAYRTLASENGANHEPSANLYLGFTQADAEAGTADNTAATADDTSGTDDEDTPAIANFFATSSSLSFDHPVVNTTGTNAYVYAWVDWDNNGRFDRDEFVSGGNASGNAIQINNNATSVNLSWFDLPTLSDNQTFITRIRITPSLLTDSASGTNEDPRSYGNAGIGEVEDHQISVTAAGVLPDIVTCAVADQAYPGRLIPELPGYNAYAGMSIVGDELYSSAATSGGLVITKRFDVQILRPNQVFNYPLNIEAEFRLKNLLDTDGDTLFWLTDHINMNGVLLADRFNAVAGWVGATAEWNGNNPLAANYSQSTWTAFANNDGTVVTTYNRYKIRMTIEADNSTQLQVTIYDDNGNEIQQSPVVDGRLAINPNNGIWLAHTTHFNDPSTQSYIFGGASILVSDNNGCDYGDAPDTVSGSSTNNYETLAINSGPSHTIVDDMYLGTNAADSDSNGFHDGTDTNSNASDDDSKGTTPDDEDGISAPINVLSEDYNLAVVCNDYSATNGNLGGVVYGWIDANRNGLFETSEAASAQCNDTSATTNGSASLSWTGLDLVGGISYLRLRITNSNLVDTSTADTQDDRAYGSTNRGEVEDHQITIAPKVSGYVFHDNGDSSGVKGNGIKDGGEAGLAGVTVTLYNATDKICTSINTSDGSTDINGDGVIDSFDVGYYQFFDEIDFGKSYQIYETAGLTSPLDCSTNPPSRGSINTASGELIGNQITDQTGYLSTSANIIDLGTISSQQSNQNFADLAYSNGFATCSTDTYFTVGNQTQLSIVDLENNTETLTASSNTNLYNGTGYSVRQNLIFAIAESTDNILVLNANNEIINSFDINLPTVNYFGAAITADDKLIANGQDGTFYVIDIDPSSASYMTLIGQSTATNQLLGDIAVHPLDGSVWGVFYGDDKQLLRFDVNTQTGVTSVTEYGAVQLNGAIEANRFGAVFFDNLGYFYGQYQGGQDIIRFDLTDPTTPNINGSKVAEARFGHDAARCMFAKLDLNPKVSGYVFHDNGNDSGIKGNGIKDGGEPGLADVAVTIYNSTDNQCTVIDSADGSTDANGDGAINSLDTGYYEFTADPAKSYTIYETAGIATPVDCSAGPPTQGNVDKATGTLIGNQIKDLSNYMSTTSNVIEIGQISTDALNQNFGDLFFDNPFGVCEKNAFVIKNAPSRQFNSFDLATAEQVTLSNASSLYSGMGYSVRQNIIYAMNYNRISNFEILAINSIGDTVNTFPIPALNGYRAISGDVTDNDILILTDTTQTIALIDVNPASKTYMTLLNRSTAVSGYSHDIAIHPQDGSTWTLLRGAPYQLARLNINMDTAATTLTNFGDTNLNIGGNTASVIQSSYFDEAGYFYVSYINSDDNNINLFRFDLTNPASPNLNAALVATGNFENGADGARCRYAPVNIDFGDAPNSYLSSIYQQGPRHKTDAGTPYIGTNGPDNESESVFDSTATGDDTTGLTPDDEDGFIQPSISTILTESDIFTVVVPVNSSGNDNLYGWIDFDGDGSFDNADEKASAVVSATGDTNLNFTVPADIKIAESMIRLRVCSSTANCDTPITVAKDGEVEDHVIDLRPTGDLELTLTMEPSVNVTLGIPFNIVVAVTNNGTTIAANTLVNLPIPTGYSFVKAYAGDGTTEIDTYNSATGILDLGNVGLGFSDYAIIRLAPQQLTAGAISAEILSTDISDTDSTPNNGFDNGEDDTDTVTPVISNTISPGICEAPSAYTRGDAFVSTNNEYIVTPNQPQQAGYLWSYDFIDLNKPMYAELAVYLGDRDCNESCAGFGREAGADGMTFVLSADPDGINAGEGNGGGLGVFGVNPSIVVEFDTFDNSFTGPTVDLIDGQHYIDHTAIYRNGNVTNPPAGGTIMPAVAALNGELEDGRYHIAQFEWDPVANLFRYYLDGILIGEVTRNIRDDLGTNVVRFGFTGSTGPAYNLQKACFTDAPNVLGSDFGDAPDISANTATGDYQTTLLNNGALHVQADSDDNGLIDLRLGSTWDADSGTLQNGLATADDELNLDDEDGVTLPPTLSTTTNFDMVVQVNEDTNRTSSGMHIYAWADWNNNGEWEVSERFVSETNANNGTNSFTNIVVPSNAEIGQVYVRVRLCSNTDCSTPLGVAMDGEVEDYRVLLSDLSPNNQCNMILQTRLPVGGTSYSYNKANVTVEPLTFTDIVNPIYIEDETDFANINSLGFDRNSGLVYGTYTDLNSTNKQQHLFVTDKEGTSFIDLGLIRSKNTQSMRRMDNGATFSFQKGDALRHNGYDSTTRVLGSATMGDVTDDGTTYIVWRTNWDSMLRIDLATQEFTVVPVDVVEMGASVGGGSSIDVSPDFAISAQNGLAYTVDYINDNLYAIDTATGVVTQSDLIYLGAKPTPDVNGKLQAGGMIIDDAISLYTITNGGNHDSDHNGSLDVVGRSVVYRVNVATAEVEYLVATNETSLQGNDAAGCFDAVDYGDALSTYGTVSHAYLDVALDGQADLALGNSWDPEFNSWFSLDAKGDDSHGRDDETLSLPSTIIVDNNTNLPIEVTGSGFINIWADLNNDGDFADSNEHIVSEQAVSNGNNDISVNLDSSAAQGFSGDTVMRIRLCSALSTCNTPSGFAADGEVEDHLFELVNHILLSGIVFDDNGLGNATLAHNGIQDGNEVGIGDVMLTLTLNDVAVNGFNTGDIIKSVTTAGNGSYQFNLDIDFSDKNVLLATVEQATWIDISESNVTSIPQVTSTSVTDGTMSITASAGNNLTGLDFGKVASPTFDTDNLTEIEPGTFVLFRHKFTALSSGIVVFNIDLNNGLPNNWTVNLFEDINCNGEIDGADAPITPINVDINSRSEVCLTAKVVVPADAKINQTLSYDVVADMTFADNAGTNHGITRARTNTDSVRATYDGAGSLTLNKTVRNITQAGDVTTSNFAKPGDVLEYVISFTNSGSGDISNVILFDTTPPFTQLDSVVTCGSDIPASNSCAVESPTTGNAAGYQGDIRWKLSSTLVAGESGTVSYRVKVE